MASKFVVSTLVKVDVLEVILPIISPLNSVAVITPTECRLLILAVAFVIITLPTKVAPEADK